jgi:ESF2/ABP1 family protein
MGPVHIRQLLTQFGELGRVFLAANHSTKKSTHRYKEDDFSEGWVEFKKKKHAKIAAQALNAKPIVSKKKTKFQGHMWNIKYLVSFRTLTFKGVAAM